MIEIEHAQPEPLDDDYTLPAALAAELNAVKCDLVLAVMNNPDPLAQLRAVKNSAKRMAVPTFHSGVHFQIIMDRLFEQAENSGIVAELGELTIATAIESGLHDLKPELPNGHAVELDAPADDWQPPGEIPGADAPAALDSPPATKSFIPVAIDDVTLSAEPAWAIYRLLPARGLACIVGPPKSGKSFLASDALFSIARNVPYAGRAVLQGPVFYCTGEGVSGFKRRAIALRRHHGVEGQGVPFFMIEEVPDLGSEATDVHRLIAVLDRFLADRGLPAPRAIALDTLARCMGSGDENTAKDMGRFIDRCGVIERHYRCLVVPIHHMGKDPGKKGRGSNSLNGGSDVTWEVEKLDGYSRVKIEEMKDGPEGATWTFRLLPVEIGDSSATLEDAKEGAETMTCVVEIMSEPALAQQSATKPKHPPRGVNGDLLKVINRAIDKVGKIDVAGGSVPNNVRAVSKDDLINYCRTMDWQQEGKPNAFRAVLSRGLSALRSIDQIGKERDWVWLIK